MDLIGKTRDELVELDVAELPKNMIFSPCCNEVTSFTAKSHTQQSGKCSCGTVVTEYKNGNLAWHKPNGESHSINC